MERHRNIRDVLKWSRYRIIGRGRSEERTLLIIKKKKKRKGKEDGMIVVPLIHSAFY